MRGARALFAVLILALLGACDSPTERWREETLSVDMPCDASVQECVVRSGATQWSVRLGPQVVALKSFPVELRASGEAPDAVRVKFAMSGMSMGLNEYRLIPAGDGVWKADVMLPICTSGRSDWLAEFTVESGDVRSMFVLHFELRPPAR